MGKLVFRDGARTHHLETENLVGRGGQCSLRLSAGYVSSQHAMITWHNSEWRIRDLGSHNGTWLDGSRLIPGNSERLREGVGIAFGHKQEQWQIVDGAGPEIMLVHVGSAVQCVVQESVIGLPSDDNPLCTLYKNPVGTWCLEHQDGATTELKNGSTISVGSDVYRLSFPDILDRTVTSNVAEEDQAIHLEFSVSGDEEYVELRLRYDNQMLDLGARNHNYLLLTLARSWLSDANRGTPVGSRGWMYKEDLVSGLQLPERVDNEVFRIRKHLARHVPFVAARIIERRARTRQLRIGASSIDIVPL